MRAPERKRRRGTTLNCGLGTTKEKRIRWKRSRVPKAEGFAQEGHLIETIDDGRGVVLENVHRGEEGLGNPETSISTRSHVHRSHGRGLLLLMNWKNATTREKVEE
jgi:hypothetical protein